MTLIKDAFTVKNDEEPTFYLGGDIHIRDGEMHLGSRTYIKEALNKIERIIGRLPSKQRTPMAPDDHPESDNSPELDDYGIKEYQGLMGILQWIVSLGRIDIN